MKEWFEGTSDIECDIGRVKSCVANLGEYYAAVVGLMPGMSEVELLEEGKDFFVIRTNEGIMTRSNIVVSIESDAVGIEFDEEYQAGLTVSAKSHYVDRFETSETGVTLRTTINVVDAPGVLGFFYRHFASSNIGNAVLKSHVEYLEGLAAGAD